MSRILRGLVRYIRNRRRRSAPGESGVTLVELMVTVVILAVAGLGIVGSFSYMARAAQLHRTTTLATNLSQEQIEVLKNKSYFEIIPTSAPTYNGNFNPSVPYDTGLYPPVTVSVGNNSFVRLTYVERVLATVGALSWVPPDSLDTGLKRITITTIWSLGGSWHQSSLSNLVASSQYSNTGGFGGKVTDATTGLPVEGADVYAKGDTLYHDFTDLNGNYTMSASPGGFSVAASAPGYFKTSPATVYTITSGNISTVNMTLTPMGSGSVSGSAWVNNSLLISEVVAATHTATISRTGSPGNNDVEYVELFNPTTFQFVIANNTGQVNMVTDYIKVNTQYAGSHNSDIFTGGTKQVYVSSYVAAGGYYLLANVPRFMLNGQWLTADAYYDDDALAQKMLPSHECGSVQITDQNNKLLDQVCWNGDSCGGASQFCNGTRIPTDASCGMNTGYSAPGCQSSPWKSNQLVRFSSMSDLGRGTYGSAYNSQNNAVDFQYPISGSASTLGPNYQPYVSTSPVRKVISGTPAYGAVITSNDGLSASAVATAVSVNGFSYATFTLVNVATGTWTVDISSGLDYLAISSVSVLASASTSVPNGATSPAWLLANLTNAILSSSTSNGIISGLVADPNGVPLSGITVTAEPATSAVTNSIGQYFLSAPPGTYSVIANPSSINGNYSSQQAPGIPVSAGQITNGNNFVLSGAGRVNGFVCNYAVSNAYPGVTVNALDINGNAVGQVVTTSGGKFIINNLSTGTYTFVTILDQDQTVSPAASGSCTSASGGISCSITAGTNVSIGTFTITGAYGVISGAVTASSSPITSGVLVVATTGTISGTLPPNLSSATMQGTPYYMASTLSDGSFSLNVRASTASATFNLYGWYTTYSGNTPSSSKRTATVTVTGGQTASASLAW